MALDGHGAVALIIRRSQVRILQGPLDLASVAATRPELIVDAVVRWRTDPDWLADYQLVSQPAKANHAGVPEIMRRSGCEATITSPPQIVAG